ncbi:MAG: ABC transporter ATP-binding protein [Desulfopila sp.]|jgi:putative ABC transport system ATP-binding protein|nr:ABC transporter ATP-binding protein [Desulfopila sp.]
MISARKINKHYTLGADRIEVLRDVSLEIEEGEFISIVGRSGSGKSTLLNVLSTLVRPDKGELYYRSSNLTDSPAAYVNTLRKSDFAVIFQFHHLLPYLTVLQNTLLPFMRMLRPVSGDIILRAEECLERIGLGDKKNRLPGNLSGGEQQRVAIARAMVTSARVLFADEPTGSLDKKTGEEIISLLVELQQSGMTIIMVTHEPHYAAIAERQIELSDGRLVQ